jgi:tetratricopeptide (TPR) repeat protein
VHLQGDQPKQAVSDFLEAIRRNGKDSFAYYQLAKVYASQGNVDEATRLYKEFIRKRPGNTQARLGLANLLFRQRKLSEAKEQLVTATENGARLAAVHVNLAVIYGLKGETANEIAHFRDAVELAPDSVRARVGLARGLAKAGRIPDAIDELASGLTKESTSDVLLLAKAQLLHSANDIQSAIIAYEQLLRAYPESIVAMTGLAAILVDTHNSDATDVQRAIYLCEYASEATQREDPRVLSTLADCYAFAGRMKEAIESNYEALRVLQQEEVDPKLLQRLQRQRVQLENRLQNNEQSTIRAGGIE